MCVGLTSGAVEMLSPFMRENRGVSPRSDVSRSRSKWVMDGKESLWHMVSQMGWTSHGSSAHLGLFPASTVAMMTRDPNQSLYAMSSGFPGDPATHVDGFPATWS